MRETPSRGRGAARMGAAGAAVGGKSRWKPSLRWYDPDQVPRVGHSLSAPKGTPRLCDPLGSIQVHGSPRCCERQPRAGPGEGKGRAWQGLESVSLTYVTSREERRLSG